MIVYKATMKNGDVYFGSTITSLARRKAVHKYEKKIKGIREACFEVLFEAVSLDEMYSYENKMIMNNQCVNKKYAKSSGKYFNTSNMGRKKGCIQKHLFVPIRCSNGKTYKSQRAAAKELNLRFQNVWKCLNGHQNTSKGFSFEYVGGAF